MHDPEGFFCRVCRKKVRWGMKKHHVCDVVRFVAPRAAAFAAAPSNCYHCDVCDIYSNSLISDESHKAGFPHRFILALANGDPLPLPTRNRWSQDFVERLQPRIVRLGFEVKLWRADAATARVLLGDEGAPTFQRFNGYFRSQGCRPRQDSSGAPYVEPLLAYNLPPELARHVAERKEEVAALLQPLRQQTRKYLANQLGPAGWFKLASYNYRSALNQLVFAEEAEVTHSLHRYDVIFPQFEEAASGRLALYLDGLAEKRPSVLRGDVVRVLCGTDGWHRGDVHFVNSDNVVLDFDRRRGAFDRYSAQRLQFSLRRTEFQLLHRAIDRAPFFLDRELLTPSPYAARVLDVTPSRDGGSEPSCTVAPEFADSKEFIDETLGRLNAEQRAFVVRAMHHESSRLQCLEGPPGTGKTATASALLNILAHVARRARNRAAAPAAAAAAATADEPLTRALIVATPSNFASDNITERLARNFRPGELLRVVALSRSDKEVAEGARPFTLPDGGGGHRMPTANELRSALVIVCTLGTCGRLFGCFPRLRASHLLVDEAGQATEADLCLALAFCDGETQRVVLAGDDKQLGPVVQSAAAKLYNFHVPALARLNADPEVVRLAGSMIKECYRCHPSILALVNLHYDRQLRPPSVGTPKWRPELSADAPHRVKLVNVCGEERQEADSPSILNIAEVNRVFDEITLLQRAGEKPEDIVVLTPYAKQAQKIRGVIFGRLVDPRVRGNPRIPDRALKVMTVEAAQGREWRNVIISCVRSVATDVDISVDIRRHLGFLSQPQRANVAVSRAIDRLVIIGNLSLLCRDVFWHKLLHAARNGDAPLEGIPGGLPYYPAPLPQAAEDVLNPHTLRESAAPDEAGVDVGYGRLE